MKKLFIYFMAAAAGCTAFSSCNEDMENFDNQAYISTNIVSTILLDGRTDDSKTINTEIAKPMDQDVTINYKADESKVATYNEAYYSDAVILPSGNYQMATSTAKINAGSIKSTDVSLTFSGLGDLDTDKTYVLPVTATATGIGMLASKSTSYYVFKGAALINVVANIKENNLYLASPASATGLNDLTTLTAECLVKFDGFGTGGEAGISTIMGIEGVFLIRIGDSGVPENQIQLATSNGNVTDAAWSLETGKWTHIAVTFDTATGATDVYINGVHKGSTQYSNYRSSVNWGNSNFYIGKSYSDNRYLDGDICEARVWNRILTADELNEKNHFYKVETTSEGLVAYWKFNEGAGNRIADSVNGYDVVAANAITWKTVSLPEK